MCAPHVQLREIQEITTHPCVSPSGPPFSITYVMENEEKSIAHFIFRALIIPGWNY
jgi:hypothetical protein